MTNIRSMPDPFAARAEVRWSWLDSRLGNHPSAPGRDADIATVVSLLNEVLATQIVCMLRYRRHHFMAAGCGDASIAVGFLAFALDEQAHADEVARRIVQLGGKPDLDPRNLCDRSRSEYVECETLDEMIFENLVAERVASESYEEIVVRIGAGDPVSCALLASILAKLEVHADRLAAMPRKRAILDARIAQLRADHRRDAS
jgi:bacterioferritin